MAISVRNERPYQSVEELVDAEGWSIGKGTFVLIGNEELEPGTTLRCELVLASGEQLIRAEGSVIRKVAAKGDRPGGVQVKIQRFTPGTRAFLQRVQELKEGSGAKDEATSRRSAPSIPPPASAEISREAGAQLSAAGTSRVSTGAQDSQVLLARLAERKPGLVDAPRERDTLLQRLRSRRQA